MRTRRLPLGLIVPVALVLLVGALGWLQYHWLGRVSEAERERLQTSLRQRAEEFADELDREVLHLYLSLQIDSRILQQTDWETFDRSYQSWRASAKYPEMLRAIYLVDADRVDATLRRYATETRTFVPTAWPDTLAPVRQRLLDAQARGQASFGRVVAGPGRTTGTAGWTQATNEARHFVAMRNPIVGSVPALLVGVPTIQQQVNPGADAKNIVSVRLDTTFVIAELDRAFLENTLLPALAARHFPERGGDSYVFAVVEAEDQGRAVFARGVPPGTTFDRQRADASVPLLAIRVELAPQILTHILSSGSAAASQLFRITPGPVPAPSAGAMVRESTFSILLQSRDGAPAGDVLKMSGRPLGLAAWQLVIRHSAGSLDLAVAQARHRNVWLSFGILAVLAASVGLVVVNARRSERLAAQQMDFVATVSHELRTPLAVIRSAAQNLSAGVVHDAEQAKRYGDLIETEGRRLTDMVEQVLEYAGLGGNRRPVLAKPVDVASILHDAAAAYAPRFESEGFDVSLAVDEDLPVVMADESGLRRAVDNLVANALKYGAEGRWIEMAAHRAASQGRDVVQVSVSDRGRGIEPDDLPHIFDPFYRGRHAIDRQIHGNGLGLSLVKRIVEAHGGRVTVRSTPGEGSTFTLHLPCEKTSEVISGSSEPIPAK